MTTEEAQQVKKDDEKSVLAEISSEIAAECRMIAVEIENQQMEIREDKVLAARMRLLNGYYQSELVIKALSNSLLPMILPTEDH